MDLPKSLPQQIHKQSTCWLPETIRAAKQGESRDCLGMPCLQWADLERDHEISGAGAPWVSTVTLEKPIAGLVTVRWLG